MVVQVEVLVPQEAAVAQLLPVVVVDKHLVEVQEAVLLVLMVDNLQQVEEDKVEDLHQLTEVVHQHQVEEVEVLLLHQTTHKHATRIPSKYLIYGFVLISVGVHAGVTTGELNYYFFLPY
jgi:hypothetical protein